MIRKIQEHIMVPQSQQKSYTDKSRRPLEFQVGDKVFLKVSPVKEVRRFNIRGGKLNPRYIGSYEIIKRLNPVAYMLDLPAEVEHGHNVFTFYSSESMFKIRIMSS